MRERLVALSFALLLFFISCGTVHAPMYAPLMPQRHAATAFTWNTSSDVAVPQFNAVDDRPAYLTDTSGFWMLYSSGDNVVHRWWGTALDTLTEQPHGTLDSSFGHPYGERYWLSSAYTNLTTWFATVHVEFDYGATPATSFNWFRKIGLATSTDKGLTWHYAGDIIFSDQSTNINDFSAYRYFQNGPGDQYMIADWRSGYFYLYYTTNWVDKVTGERWQSTRVARSPLAANLAPGSWTKWYNGGWSQPGIGGKDSDVFLNEDNAAVFYDTYIGEYVALGHSTFDVTYITTATSLDTQNWQPLTHFVSDTELQFYNWVVDSTTADPFTIGQTLRVYSSQNAFQGVSSTYLTLTFASGMNTNPPPTPQQYQYPYQSVPDFNAGWQRSPDEPVGLLINGDMELDPNIPSSWITWPPLYNGAYAIHIVTSGQYDGAQAVTEDARNTGQTIEHPVTVLPNTRYQFCAWVRSTDGSALYVGQKNGGTPETNTPITSAGYTHGCVIFTTGNSATSVTVYLWHPSGGVVYADDATMTTA